MADFLQGTTDTTTAQSKTHLSFLQDEVQCLVGGTSEKFAPTPSGNEVLGDLIIGLRRFEDTVRT